MGSILRLFLLVVFLSDLQLNLSTDLVLEQQHLKEWSFLELQIQIVLLEDLHVLQKSHHFVCFKNLALLDCPLVQGFFGILEGVTDLDKV